MISTKRYIVKRLIDRIEHYYQQDGTFSRKRSTAAILTWYAANEIVRQYPECAIEKV
jgi:hypothetical protein